MNETENYLLSSNAIQSYIIAAVAVVLMIVLHFFSKKYRTKTKVKGQRKTIAVICFDVVRALIFAIAILMILSVNGVNVTSLVAGLGIASAIVGLALQDLLKDLFMGYRIISDNFFALGDYVEFEGREGYVSAFTLNSTQITDIADNSVFCVTNRNISKIRKLPSLFFVSIPVPYDADKKLVNSVLNNVCVRMKQIKTVDNCELLGADCFNASDIGYKFKISCKLKFKYANKRELIKLVLEEYETNGISVPYETLTLISKQ